MTFTPKPTGAPHNRVSKGSAGLARRNDPEEQDWEDFRMVIRNREGAEIHSVEDWKALAPPASSEQWKDGRSAKELALAWTTGSGPAALIELFAEHDDLSALQIRDAVAEAQVAFDEFPGGKNATTTC
jgi:hypothetical protein